MVAAPSVDALSDLLQPVIASPIAAHSNILGSALIEARVEQLDEDKWDKIALLNKISKLKIGA